MLYKDRMHDRRFTRKESNRGIHVPPDRYYRFIGKLENLLMHLESKILGYLPEEKSLRLIFINLLIILDNDLTYVITQKIKTSSVLKDKKILSSIKKNTLSFKSKVEYAKKEQLITQKDFLILDQIRKIRNFFSHKYQNIPREKQKYFDKNVLLDSTIKKIFLDCNKIHQKLIPKSLDLFPTSIFKE